MALLLGCIADDFTGATDLANTLVAQGMRVVQTIGVPDPASSAIAQADAIVVALKSRTAPVAEATAASLAALDVLRALGAKQFFFKYCSTFDSTDKGNIGPVADALQDRLEANFSLVCPAFPTTKRTIYLGHLFVGDTLLSESSMRDHPLTPMTDANLVRVMAKQTRYGVGLISYPTVLAGAAAIANACQALRQNGKRYAVIDALTDNDLLTIGEAAAGHALLTGGSGLALGLPANFRRAGLLDAALAPELPAVTGRAVVLAGSCSVATRAQVEHVKRDWPTFAIKPGALADGEPVVERALSWAAQQPPAAPLLFYSSASPEQVAAVQAKYGRAESGALVEQAFGEMAKALVGSGTRRLVVAGGETSGAVVSALGVKALRIGPQIDPGVPWTEAIGGSTDALALALKSGNFGSEDFFAKALAMLP